MGFSPFELESQGPLNVMKEVWSGLVTGSQNVISHFLQMRERLASMTDLIKENSQEAQMQQNTGMMIRLRLVSSNHWMRSCYCCHQVPTCLKLDCLGHTKLSRGWVQEDYEIELGDKQKKHNIFYSYLLKKFVHQVPEALVCVEKKDVGGDEEGQDKDVT